MKSPRSKFTTLGSLTAVLGLLLCGGLACTKPCPEGFVPVELPGFLLGTSQGGSSTLPHLEELGIPWMRVGLSWRSLERTIEGEPLTRADVDADPAMIGEYIASRDWTYYDTFLSDVIARGITPFALIGSAFGTSLPDYQGERLTPDRIGRENYLGHLYRHVRTVVERYDGDGVLDAPGGIVVKYWQTENELNQAFFTALWGWRTPMFLDAIGSAWQDWDYVTEILKTLRAAVKTEDPEAITTTNFHTDVHPNFNKLLLQPSWEEAIVQWRDYIDIVSYDAYPNYYLPEPVGGERHAEIVALADELGCGRPVMVMETGYPSGPAERGFTEALQAEYIQEAYDAVVGAGAAGFFLFGVETTESHSTEITEGDLAVLDALGPAFQDGDALGLVLYALTHTEYLQSHFIEVLQTVEPYWGLFRADGSHKPSWDVVRGIAGGR